MRSVLYPVNLNYNATYKGVVIIMTVRDAVRQRILNLCEIHHITLNRLALDSSLTQSTLSSIINTGSNNPTLSTIARVCAGLKISVREFFNDEVFDHTEEEII
jgi:transcriptional regulator with XRE-family HTH domain